MASFMSRFLPITQVRKERVSNNHQGISPQRIPAAISSCKNVLLAERLEQAIERAKELGLIVSVEADDLKKELSL